MFDGSLESAVNAARRDDSEVVKVRPQREYKIPCLIAAILNIPEHLRATSLIARKAAYRLVRELNLTGLANPRLQRQLFKAAISYRRLCHATKTIWVLSPEDHFRKRLAPKHLVLILSDENLSKPRYIRLGKKWVKDERTSCKVKIAPQCLTEGQFLTWLRAEIHKATSNQIQAEINGELDEIDPSLKALSLDSFTMLWNNTKPLTSEWLLYRRNRQSWFWDRSDPAEILERLEEKGLWNWQAVSAKKNSSVEQTEDLLSKMMSEGSPQTRNYINGLDEIIAEGTNPSELEDNELSSLIEISPQRIRQLRHTLRKKYHHPANNFAL